MARTRSAKAAPAKPKASEAPQSTESKFALVSNAGESPKIFILPSKSTPEARIVTLPHPRHSRPSRYLVCPKAGIYEFTKIAAPKSTPRSWLIESAEGSDSKNEVTMGSDLFVATAVDPLFLVLPALAESKISKGSDEPKRLFLTSDDHFDKLPQDDSHMSEILRWDATRTLIEARMGAICDTVDAGDESMFRLSEKKLLDVILEKAKRMSEGGLSLSMEDKFVKKMLEAPLVLKKIEAKESKAATSDSGSSTPLADSATSQSTASTADTDASQPSTAATSFTDETIAESLVSAIEASPEVTKLQRLRVAFDFICSNYVTPILADQLKQSLAKGDIGSTDFSPLDDYLTSLAKLRSEALATSSSADFSLRRRRDEDEDEARAEKRRKLEEDKKKKASESRAVRDLKKVNTTGMKKLSEFFKKK
ncbi:Ribonuclease H2 subunit B [Cladobotryum mycophilum]|uniref:Ribonuclease H2 subunit B n=1 Tax=Cladobotryum mycophilum TaxID=491253 RepID=A0ABR0S6N7_9HYPO